MENDMEYDGMGIHRMQITPLDDSQSHSATDVLTPRDPAALKQDASHSSRIATRKESLMSKQMDVDRGFSNQADHHADLVSRTENPSSKLSASEPKVDRPPVPRKPLSKCKRMCPFFQRRHRFESMLVERKSEASKFVHIVLNHEVKLGSSVFSPSRSVRIDWILPDEYSVTHIVGAGAFGIVAAGVDKKTGNRVAIKRCEKPFRDPILAKRLLREISLLRQLQHPFVIELRDVLRIPSVSSMSESVCLSFELADVNLVEVFRRARDMFAFQDKSEHRKFALTERNRRKWMLQILLSLQYIHSRGVVHRDIKPDNILLNSDGDIRLCDFGLARALPDEEGDYSEGLPGSVAVIEEDLIEQAEAAILGVDHASVSMMNTDNLTPPRSGAAQSRLGSSPSNASSNLTIYVITRWYRAPEVLLRHEKYTPRVDLWAAGCVFAEMYTQGSALFRGNGPLNQLNRIFTVLGTPTSEQIRDISCPEALDWLKQQPMLKGRGLRATLLPHLKHAASTASNFSSLSHSLSPPTFLGRPSPSSGLYGSSLHAAVDSGDEDIDVEPDLFLDLLEKLLTFHPSQRISVDEAIKHPYFTPVRDECLQQVVSFFGLDVNSTSASEDESVCRRSSDQEGSISSFDRIETRTSQLEDLDEDRMYGAGGLSDLQNPARFGLRKARLRRGGFGNDLVEARNTRLECSDSELDRSRRSLGHIFTGQYRSDREYLSGISTDSSMPSPVVLRMDVDDAPVDTGLQFEFEDDSPSAVSGNSIEGHIDSFSPRDNFVDIEKDDAPVAIEHSILPSEKLSDDQDFGTVQDDSADEEFLIRTRSQPIAMIASHNSHSDDEQKLLQSLGGSSSRRFSLAHGYPDSLCTYSGEDGNTDRPLRLYDVLASFPREAPVSVEFDEETMDLDVIREQVYREVREHWHPSLPDTLDKLDTQLSQLA